MYKVDYSGENLDECRCPVCPVQEHSKCAQGKIKAMGDGSTSNISNPREMPELYCSEAVDGSSCDDIDVAKSCLCPTCEVWQENELISHYYCENGSAEVNG